MPHPSASLDGSESPSEFGAYGSDVDGANDLDLSSGDGNRSDGDRSDGDRSDGDRSDGDRSDGDRSGGAVVDCEDGSGGEEATKTGRVRANDGEKIWIFNAGMTEDCPLKNGADLDKSIKAVCAKLAGLVTTMSYGHRQQCKKYARGGYRDSMVNIETNTVKNLFTSGVRKLRKQVKIVPGTEKREDGPQAEVPTGCVDGDAKHHLHQLALDWDEVAKTALGGSDEGASKGKSRVKAKKDSANETRKRRAEQYKTEAKKKKEEKEAEKAEVRADRERFTTNMDSMAFYAGVMAGSVSDSTKAALAMANYKMFGVLPAAPLTMAPPPAPAPPAGAPASAPASTSAPAIADANVTIPDSL